MCLCRVQLMGADIGRLLDRRASACRGDPPQNSTPSAARLAAESGFCWRFERSAQWPVVATVASCTSVPPCAPDGRSQDKRVSVSKQLCVTAEHRELDAEVPRTEL